MWYLRPKTGGSCGDWCCGPSWRLCGGSTKLDSSSWAERPHTIGLGVRPFCMSGAVSGGPSGWPASRRGRGSGLAPRAAGRPRSIPAWKARWGRCWVPPVWPGAVSITPWFCPAPCGLNVSPKASVRGTGSGVIAPDKAIPEEPCTGGHREHATVGRASVEVENLIITSGVICVAAGLIWVRNSSGIPAEYLGQ